MRTSKRYGWIPQRPDYRDRVFELPNLGPQGVPPSVDLSPFLPACYDQGQLGSCTANAIAGALQFEMHKDTSLPLFMPSRLFIYYQEREIEGDTSSDNGAQIRDGIKAVKDLGVPAESEWPYVIEQFSERPSDEAYISAGTFDAFTRKTIRYEAVDAHLVHLKACLASGYPFVFGMSVFESFESEQVAETGVVPMPGSNETMVGGHAVLCVGYDDAEEAFLVRNSWGSSWGIKQGHFWLPYAYISMISDCWKISLVG